MQKHANLVDLVKSFPTNILLQNLASIQKRTSHIKFAHLAEKSEKGSISNLSTKVHTATSATTHGQPDKPTVALGDRFNVRIVRKQREMRFGAVAMEMYSTFDDGQSWYRENCAGVALYLVCYDTSAKVVNGKEEVQTVNLVLKEGDVVGASVVGASLEFSVNGAQVVSTPLPSGMSAPTLAVQFHTTDDAVELLTEAQAKAVAEAKAKAELGFK